MPRLQSGRSVLKVGFISLVDAAPFFVAADYGLFSKYGLKVGLSREVGWATIREKVLYGELDAVQALCPMPFASTLGVHSSRIPCVSGMQISKGGNAIVLSGDLWKRGVRDGKSLRQDIANSRYFRKYIFATVYAFSTHAFLIRDWLTSSGIDVERDVQLVNLPPSQMCRNLAAGTIDGFCAGEPWPSLAISQEMGWSPAVSVDIAPSHPEKALMVRESFAEEHPNEHLSLIAALTEACAFCDRPENRDVVARCLSGRLRVNCDESLLMECLTPSFNYGMGRLEQKRDFIRFHEGDANRPRSSDALWILQRMGLCDKTNTVADLDSVARQVYREDIFDAATKRILLS